MSVRHLGELGQPGHARPHVLGQSLRAAVTAAEPASSGGMRAGLSATPSAQSLMSGSAVKDRRPGAEDVHAAPSRPACWRTAKAGRAGSSRRRPRRVASTYPARAAPKQGKPARIGCSVIASGPQIGTSGGYCSPAAAQCTTTASRAMATDPRRRSAGPARTRRRWPSRTTCSIVRSWSSSHVGERGRLRHRRRHATRSMRSMMPASSSRRNRSSERRRAAAAACMMSAAMPRKTPDPAGPRRG